MVRRPHSNGVFLSQWGTPFTDLRASVPDGKQFCPGKFVSVSKIEGNIPCWRAISVHFVGHLPSFCANGWAAAYSQIRTVRNTGSKHQEAHLFPEIVVQKYEEPQIGREGLPSSFLGSHSKELGHQGRLPSHIPFVHSLHLVLASHVHHLIPSEGSPSGQEGKESHAQFCQALDEAMILFNQVIQVLNLSQLDHLGKNSSCF
jgi:hypothetical protein